MSTAIRTALQNFIDRAEKEVSKLEAHARAEISPDFRRSWDDEAAQWRLLIDAAREALRS